MTRKTNADCGSRNSDCEYSSAVSRTRCAFTFREIQTGGEVAQCRAGIDEQNRVDDARVAGVRPVYGRGREKSE
jgi:hypothetical protein